MVRILIAVLLLYQALILEWGEPREFDDLYSFATQYAHLAIVPFAIMLLVGYRARMAIVVCWLIYSLPIRANSLAEIPTPMGDYTLNLALFWCMFLPLDRHLCWTSSGRDEAPARFLSVASGGLLFQIFIVYLSAGLLKDLSEWLIKATAMDSILSNPKYDTALGTILLDYPVVLAVMSVATIVVEILGSLLVMIPGKSLPSRRRILVPVFIVFHIGIAVLMGLEFFPYVMIVQWLLFLPSSFWGRVWRRFGAEAVAVEVAVDTKRWRNWIAAVAVALATISNVITWTFYANYSNLPYLVDRFEDVVVFLTIRQRWLMFNVPSLISPG